MLNLKGAKKFSKTEKSKNISTLKPIAIGIFQALSSDIKKNGFHHDFCQFAATCFNTDALHIEEFKLIFQDKQLFNVFDTVSLHDPFRPYFSNFYTCLSQEQIACLSDEWKSLVKQEAASTVTVESIQAERTVMAEDNVDEAQAREADSLSSLSQPGQQQIRDIEQLFNDTLATSRTASDSVFNRYAQTQNEYIDAFFNQISELLDSETAQQSFEDEENEDDESFLSHTETAEFWVEYEDVFQRSNTPIITNSSAPPALCGLPTESRVDSRSQDPKDACRHGQNLNCKPTLVKHKFFEKPSAQANIFDERNEKNLEAKRQRPRTPVVVNWDCFDKQLTANSTKSGMPARTSFNIPNTTEKERLNLIEENRALKRAQKARKNIPKATPLDVTVKSKECQKNINTYKLHRFIEEQDHLQNKYNAMIAKDKQEREERNEQKLEAERQRPRTPAVINWDYYDKQLTANSTTNAMPARTKDDEKTLEEGQQTTETRGLVNWDLFEALGDQLETKSTTRFG